MDATIRVGLVHATPAAMDPMLTAFAQQLPQVRLLNFLDEGLLDGLNRAGSLTPGLVRRLATVLGLAESAGVAGVLMTCSSYSPVAPVVRGLVSIPVLPVDEVLIEEAISAGRHIGVVATVAAALPTTTAGLEAEARRRDTSVTVAGILAEGAFEALAAGASAQHDQLIANAARRLALQEHVDAVVLAQASMVRALPAVGELPVPILTSPTLGVARLAQLLELSD